MDEPFDYNELFKDFDPTGSVDEGRFALDIPDKISECEFFLNLMEQTTDWNKFRWLTSAFLEAARAAVEWIAYRAYRVRYFDDEGEEHVDRELLQKIKEGLAKYMKIWRDKKNGRVHSELTHALLKEEASNGDCALRASMDQA